MEFRKQVSFRLALRQPDTLPLGFVARMLVVYLLWIRGMEHVLPPFLPFVPQMDVLRDFPTLYRLLDWVYWISLVMVFAGIRMQRFALVLGMVVLFSILSSKPQFSNSFLYSGCFLILIGLYRPGLEWIFRTQLSLLYLGAGLNKLLDPDWQSGQYFEFFFTEVYPHPVYGLVQGFFLPGILAMMLSWTVLLTELLFGIWTLTNRKTKVLFLLIQVFHLSMLVLTFGELSFLFYFLMAVSSYLLLPWEAEKRRSDENESSYPARLAGRDVLDRPPLQFSFQKGIFKTWIEVAVFNRLIFGAFVLMVTFSCMYRYQITHLLSQLW